MLLWTRASGRSSTPRCSRRRPRPRRRDGHRDQPAALPRRVREVGPAAAPRLAPRRDGGPDAGLGADPRGDHGDGRRLHGRPRPRALRAVAAWPSTWSPWVGVLTAVFAATIALVQTDIKRVLAYSTVSQLGYMFVGVGVGRLRGGRLPPGHPRVLQGAACSSAPARSSTRCAASRTSGRWAASRGSSRSPGGRCSIATVGDRRLPALLGLLLEGRDPRQARSSPASRRSSLLGLIGSALTAFYMWRLDLPHVPGPVARRPRRRRTTPTSRRPS